ncbi:MAG TPA: RagB/SusD family nutrient uptake outer membrane protein, partial [Chitinophagaceae bacterium]
MKSVIKFLVPSLLLIATAGCKKTYLETAPSNAVTQVQLFSNTVTTAAAQNGTYSELYAYGTGGSTGHDNFGQKALDLANDLMGNDMVVNTAGYGWFNADYQYTEWTHPQDQRRSYNAWYLYYDIIKQSNFVITYVGNATGAQADKDVLRGQALGLRAFCYFYLINDMQQTYKGNETKPGVPIYTAAASGIPVPVARGTVQDVYTQMITDLTAAETLLTGKTVPDKNHIDVHVVQGLRARVALLMEDWPTAVTYAHKAYQGFTLMSQTDYQKGFNDLTNSEWMWGSSISAAQSTIYASWWSHIDASVGGYATLGSQKKITKALYDQINASDVRKQVFVGPGAGNSTFPDYDQVKFEVADPNSFAGDYLYMRAAEMYLIEAEAYSRQGMDGPARTSLQNLIKTRYPAYSAAALSGA